ncbi:hypothetical protein [Streptomyces sp. NPDC048516]
MANGSAALATGLRTAAVAFVAVLGADIALRNGPTAHPIKA